MEIGAQLYTVRQFIQNPKDFERTISKVADIGYRTVQLSRLGVSVSAETARKVCDSYGVRIVLTHTDVNRILYDTDRVIEEHKIMGCDYIGLGSMPEKYEDPEWIEYFAEDFKEPIRKMKDAGILFMYHNHDLDFIKVRGKYLLDYLLEAFTPDELGVTLDTYWLAAAGADIFEWIEKCADRIPCVHLKDRMITAKREQIWSPVGTGNLDFKKIMAALEKTSCRYALVEQDTCEESPFYCLKKSYDYLKQIGYVGA